MPKVSIFTPTHGVPRAGEYLARLYRSLKAQTCEDWEWVLVPNNGDEAVQNCRALSDDRIKVFPCESNNSKIGFLKKLACSWAKGDILLEVDHDDELFPTAIEECVAAFVDSTVDFAYSNSVDVREGYKPRIHGEGFGWEYRPARYRNHNVIEIVSFSPGPRSLSKIWFAPNHFRAWRRSFYERVGGHNETLAVLDDQDLISRTYLNGKMLHINKPLYVYHIHEDNTCYGELNNSIQEQTLVMHDRYAEPMALHWAQQNGLLCLDLCGGHGKPPGYHSIDMHNADIIADLNKPWDFADGSVGVIRASDALEHLKDPIHVMKEAYRVLAPNGWFFTNTPSTDGRGAFQDPTHISFWNSNSFWYFTRQDQAKYIGTPVKFQLSRINNYFPSEWHKLHNIVYVRADLVKFSGRTPGRVEI